MSDKPDERDESLIQFSMFQRPQSLIDKVNREMAISKPFDPDNAIWIPEVNVPKK